jgi:hypothetical protein
MSFMAVISIMGPIDAVWAVDPPQVDLSLWLRADTGINGGAVLDGTRVSSWANQIPGWGDATQGTASSQPSFHTNAINGLPAIRFNPDARIPDKNNNIEALNLPSFDLPPTVSL